ncbi:MAG: hypothetical protein PQJ59_16410 [Spirochaetales bacterium]|nr:hypothetical protein [Spirochaetales bacterium]
MTPLVPLLLWGWIPLSIYFFSKYTPQRASLLVLVGGVLFLPHIPNSLYHLPVVTITKNIILSFALLVGIVSSPKARKYKFKLEKYDYPILLWCSVVPIFSALSNRLGFYHGFNLAINQGLRWGVFYYVGRRFFTEEEHFTDICYAIIWGGILYVPLCLYEVMESPLLSINLYGFFAHDWAQHIRKGGYRPIVFMQHGLMLSLWMAFSAIVSFWFWKVKRIKKLLKVPLFIVSVTLIVMTYYTKSSGAFLFMFLVIAFAYIYSGPKSNKYIKIIIMILFIYMFTRITMLLSSTFMATYLSKIFGPARIQSLWFRLYQEEVLSRNMRGKYLFGWGGLGRGLQGGVGIVDAMWLIYYNLYGLFGLFTLYTTMLIGPWLLVRKNIKLPVEVIILSLIIIVFMIDCLLNAMNNPVYIMIAGALVSYNIELRNKKIILCDQ